MELWDTGNVDAHTLALMIADPDRINLTSAGRWVRQVDYYLRGDLLGALVARLRWIMVRHRVRLRTQLPTLRAR